MAGEATRGYVGAHAWPLGVAGLFSHASRTVSGPFVDESHGGERAEIVGAARRKAGNALGRIVA